MKNNLLTALSHISLNGLPMQNKKADSLLTLIWVRGRVILPLIGFPLITQKR